MATSALVFAHQGGWDEIALVLVPLLVIFMLLLVANRRARRLDPSDDTRDLDRP